MATPKSSVRLDQTDAITNARFAGKAGIRVDSFVAHGPTHQFLCIDNAFAFAFLFQRLLESIKGFLADMVFDSFGVGRCDFGADTDRKQKLIHDLVSLSRFLGETPTLGCQLDRLIGLRFQPAFALQSCDDAVNRDIADRELLGQVPRTACAGLI